MKPVSLCVKILFIFCILFNVALADSTDVQPQPKSPGKALAWSLLGTLVPYSMGLTLNLTTDGLGDMVGNQLSTAGIVFGPSAGYFYGGVQKQGEKGMAVRGGLLLGIDILILAAGENGELRSDRQPAATFIAAAAVIVIIVDAICDIAQADGAVRKRNQELAQTGWLITPKYFAKSKTPGLQLQITF